MKRALTPVAAKRCYLCEKELAAEIAEDFYCYGCKEYICEDHAGCTPFGAHDPEDHLEEE